MHLRRLLLVLLASSGLAARCGKDFDSLSCAPDECCSEAGYCSTGPDFCKSPQCQIQYSHGNCDADQRPCGRDTEGVPRNQGSDVPYGVIVKACTVPGKVALTFDDGPYEHTEKVLDILKEWKARATFFVSGNNLGKGMIDDPTLPWPALIRRMFNEGHQVGSHGWSHQNMDEIGEDRREQEIIYNEMALRNILGLIPKYFRPPYGVCGGDCLAQLKSWGIHAINWSLDTRDVFHNTPETIQTSKDIVKDGILPIEAYDDELRVMYNRSYLVLMHDTQYQTAYTLTDFTVRHALDQGYELVTVAECLGDTGYWYHDARYEEGANDDGDYQECLPDSGNVGLVTPPQPSKDGTCGSRSNGKYTCEGSSYGNCCSYLGFCGSTSGYCDGGCQDDFGTCNTMNCGDPPIVSENGLCGGKTHQTCLGSSYGDCCSEFGNCGSGKDYCGDGCQEYFGNCDE